MPNSNLENNTYKCPNELIKYLSSIQRKYRGGEDEPGAKKLNNIINSGELSYQQMKNMKSFFDKIDNGDSEKNDEYHLNGGEKMKKWVNKELSTARDADYQVKKTRMDAGEENQFKETHNKNKYGANPTKVRTPNIAKSSKARNIMTNKVVYESLYEEIKEINYLIEYMNNNNKNKI